jgi:hypothetical protein
LKNIIKITAKLSKICGVETDYWGCQDPIAERYVVSGNYDAGHFWTRPDPLHFPKIVTRPDPTRTDPRVDPTRGQLFCVGLTTRPRLPC